MKTGIHIHAILMALLSSCSCLHVHVKALHVHVPTCESRRRSWVAGCGAKDVEFPCIFVSSSANDDGNGGDVDAHIGNNDGGPTPLFPELANPAPLPPPQSYDDAADALQNRRRGPTSSIVEGQSGERALSTSEEIRNALEADGGGGLAAAAMAIRKAMSPDGDWYNAADDGHEADVAVESIRDKILDFLLGEGVDPTMDSTPDANDELGSSSPLTNLDFLLGKLGERGNDES